MLTLIWLRGLLGRRGGRLAGAGLGVAFAVALLAALGRPAPRRGHNAGSRQAPARPAGGPGRGLHRRHRGSQQHRSPAGRRRPGR